MVEPFDEANVKSNSMDLRLAGTLKIYVDKSGRPLDQAWKRGVEIYGPPEDERGQTNEKLFEYLERCDAILDPKKKPNIRTLTIPPDGIILVPGRGYLGSTMETIRTDHFVPAMHGRSSIGRLFVSPHHTAGWGDTGFSGSWTLEITCEMPTRVYPGMRICQLSFETTTGERVLYGDIEGSRYQDQNEPVESRLYDDFVDG